MLEPIYLVSLTCQSNLFGKFLVSRLDSLLRRIFYVFHLEQFHSLQGKIHFQACLSFDCLKDKRLQTSKSVQDPDFLCSVQYSPLNTFCPHMRNFQLKVKSLYLNSNLVMIL